jgi:ribonuclease HI
VTRDDQGRVIKAGAGRADFLLSALHAELLACYAGLREAIKMGEQDIIVETDATLVKDALLGDDYRLSTVGDLVTEMKFLISAELSSCNISVCKRECNKVAHTLAASGCNFPSGSCTIWDGVPGKL